MNVSKLVEKLEKELEIWRNFHREELQEKLGKDFSIGELRTFNNYCHIENNFFPIIYKEKPFGILLPFRKKKKAVFASPRNKNLYNHASKVLTEKGYNIQLNVAQVSRQDLTCLTVDDEYLSYMGG